MKYLLSLVLSCSLNSPHHMGHHYYYESHIYEVVNPVYEL